MHQCVHCGKMYDIASRELLEGCSCGSHFFFFIKKEQLEMLKENKIPAIDLNIEAKKKIEKDVREMIGEENQDMPVILDLESIRVSEPGKFEIDVVNLFNKKRPLIYKLEEGKYIIDLASTLRGNLENIHEKIKNPDKKKKR